MYLICDCYGDAISSLEAWPGGKEGAEDFFGGCGCCEAQLDELSVGSGAVGGQIIATFKQRSLTLSNQKTHHAMK